MHSVHCTFTQGFAQCDSVTVHSAQVYKVCLKHSQDVALSELLFKLEPEYIFQHVDNKRADLWIFQCVHKKYANCLHTVRTLSSGYLDKFAICVKCPDVPGVVCTLNGC